MNKTADRQTLWTEEERRRLKDTITKDLDLGSVATILTTGNARHGEGEGIVKVGFIVTDLDGIESVGAVSAVFEQVFKLRKRLRR